MFWSFKGYNIGLCFGASRVIILDCVLELQGLYYFGASKVIWFVFWSLLVCVSELQGYNIACVLEL